MSTTLSEWLDEPLASSASGRPADPHSGRTRARQTAEAWGGLLDVDVEQADALAPNDDATIWVGRLVTENDDVMLVGHLPHLARLTALLLIGAADRPLIQFHQGGMVALESNRRGLVSKNGAPTRSSPDLPSNRCARSPWGPGVVDQGYDRGLSHHHAY